MMIRVRTVVSIVIALVFVSLFALPIAEAQEATSTPAASGTPVVCDSALVLLVGLAEQDFGYMPPNGLGPFEWGQFTSMFGSSLMMATQEPGAMSTPEATMTVMLQAPVVLGEDAQCTELRKDVVQFVTDHASMMSSTSTNSTAPSTPMSTEMPTSMSSTAMPSAPVSTEAASG